MYFSFVFVFVFLFFQGGLGSQFSAKIQYIFSSNVFISLPLSVSGCPYEAKLKAASTIATISKVVQLNVKEFKCVSYALRSLPYGY